MVQRKYFFPDDYFKSNDFLKKYESNINNSFLSPWINCYSFQLLLAYIGTFVMSIKIGITYAEYRSAIESKKTDQSITNKD